MTHTLSDNEKAILSCWGLLFIIAFVALLTEAPPSTPRTFAGILVGVTLVGGGLWLPYMGTVVHHPESDNMGEVIEIGDNWYIMGLKTSDLLSGLMGPYATKQDAESEHKTIEQFLARQQEEKSKRQLLALGKEQAEKGK